MVKRVYLPTIPAWVTNTRSTTPAGYERCSERKRILPVRGPACAATLLCVERRGQPRPQHEASANEPPGARTDKSRILAPRRVSQPAMRTTGKGSSTLGPRGGGGVPSHSRMKSSICFATERL